MTEPILLAWSGGKDSTMALAALRGSCGARVVGLLTAVTPAYDRVSIHGVRRSILHAQGAALGLPVIEARLDPGIDDAGYETAWADAIRSAAHLTGPDPVIAYGDLFLEDVRAFRDDLAHRLGVRTRYPIWGGDTARLAREFVAAGYEAYLTCVDTTQLDGAFVGRRYDAALLADLPATVDPCGERGEFHTCVVAGPLFRERIAVTVGERVLREERFAYADLVPA